MATGRRLHFQRIAIWNRRGPRLALAALVVAAAAVAGRPASASSVTYTIDPAQSSITGNLRATFAISITASCFILCSKPFTGTGQVGDGTGAPLASRPTGSLTADWGSPGWSDSITFSSLSLDNPDPGSAAGSFSLVILKNLLSANFTGTVNISNISVGLGSSVTASPLDPSEVVPGAGPWASSGTANLVLGATAGGSVMGTGLFSFVKFTIPAFTFGGTGPGNPVTIDGTLSRLFSGPDEVGSGLVFDATGASIVLGPQASSTIDVNQNVGFGVTIKSVTMTLTSLTLDNIDAHVVATSGALIPTPEPGTAALLGLGLLGLALRRRADR